MRAAIIGGTGIGDRLLKNGGEPLKLESRFGSIDALRTPDGLVLLSRHSAGHKVPPHAVNYRAMALGLKSLGVQFCLSAAAVGSLREDWGPGTLALCNDFLELSGRNQTLFETEVHHQDFSVPFGIDSQNALRKAALEKQISLHEGAVYACTNGPRYETPAEVRMLRMLGADVVGMTAGTEAVLMREAGIDYACLAVVTNFATGIAQHSLSHEEVVEQMQISGETAVEILRQAALGL